MVTLANAIQSFHYGETPVNTCEEGFDLLLDKSEKAAYIEALQPLVEDQTICKVEEVVDKEMLF